MKRRRLSNRDRVKIFEAAGGKCHLCGRKIQVGEPWDADHDDPLWLGGADDLTNIKPAHERCHLQKSRADNGKRAKSDRVKAKHTGAYRPKITLPGSRRSPWKRKMNGEVVRR